jgi:hypothetical protein
MRCTIEWHPGPRTSGEAEMTLIELLPQLQSLSRVDKLQLIQHLAQELAGDEIGLVKAGQSYPVWSPDQAFSAAAVMIQTLESDRGSM